VAILFCDGCLHVQLLPEARNPIFFRGQRSDKFVVRSGEHFVVGQTTFTLVDERVRVAPDSPHPANERTFTLEELRAAPFRHADKRIEVLGRLPDIISGSATDQEMFVRLVNLLMTGVERATAVAVVEVGSKFDVQSSKLNSPTLNLEPGTLNPVSVLHWDRRVLSSGEFRPSAKLIRQAVETGQSVAHVWSTSSPRGEGEFTVSEGIDWAFCTPIASQACKGWALYVTGSFGSEFGSAAEPDPEVLRDDVKFAELTAATLAALRESRLLASAQAGLRQFFSPVVLEALAQQDAAEALAPREADVTVLFCDLRGFTQQSELAAGNLFDLLERVSLALGVMTRHILAQGGVVGDFHGDAAMGFWGWPIPQPDAALRACRAALAIQADFSAAARHPGDPLANFRVGIGIASGRAVAGKIGTTDQVKVTVFGPVVNLASRLETMTQHLHASILIDPPTAAVVRASVPRSVARVRRLARIRPVGLTAPLDVSELLPPASAAPAGAPTDVDGNLSDADIAAYEAALTALENRDWNLALKLLHQVPPDDQAKDFLTIFIAQHNRTPPPNWDGAISLAAK
jgi:adenylate cyclase